ncbi:hypothetical protein [Gemmatimonas sp.]|uniref:hypothetical protein n=1 Tax=Gemmatimonas sp. TaxID=1962908 RepID=UPI00333FD46D
MDAPKDDTAPRRRLDRPCGRRAWNERTADQAEPEALGDLSGVTADKGSPAIETPMESYKMSQRPVDQTVATARGGLGGVLWRGVMVWLIPFAGTAPLVDSSGSPIVSIGIFKSVALGLLLAVLLVVRRWPARGIRVGVAAAAYTAMSVVLDLAVLVGAFHMPVAVWGATVLPAYALIPLVLLLRPNVHTSR